VLTRDLDTTTLHQLADAMRLGIRSADIAATVRTAGKPN
jgi:hypothetical protein